jgi:hypothetical protein
MPENLKYVNIPKNLKDEGKSVFYGCRGGLTNSYLED